MTLWVKTRRGSAHLEIPQLVTIEANEGKNAEKKDIMGNDIDPAFGRFRNTRRPLVRSQQSSLDES